MNKYLAIPLAALLFSCSEKGGTVVSSGDSDRDVVAPSSTVLTSNYTAPLTEAKIAADVALIQNSDNLLAKAMGVMFTMPSSESSLGMAKVAVETCQNYDMDTTFVTVTGDTISTKTTFTKDGKPFEYCMDPDSYDFTGSTAEEAMGPLMLDMMAQKNGVKSNVVSSVKSPNLVSNAEVTWLMNLEGTGEDMVMSYELDGYFYGKQFSPEVITLMVEFDMAMNSASEGFTGTYKINFMDGRYQCEMDISTGEGCDLTHNGEVVGEFGN